jgi:PleD family two-component response regulator
MYVYFIDLNDLYEVNKNGHIAGDNFIKSFTENISKTLSLEDFFIRYGGDEFILFTSARNKLSTCTMYAVGSCSVQGNIMESIEKADKNMLKNKKLFKSKSI